MPRDITLSIICLMGLEEYDYMGYKLDASKAEYHHIVKREHKGETTRLNGAVLMPEAHNFLHIIEYKEPQIYELINRMFVLMNNRGYIIENDYMTIGALLTLFEKKHNTDLNSKGKVLIRNKYKDRKWK